MVGILVNQQRATKTRQELDQVLEHIASVAAGRMNSGLKSRDLLRGKGAWHGVPGNVRANIITNMCDWLAHRRHDLALAAIDNDAFASRPFSGGAFDSPWQACALHVALQVQRSQQGKSRNKGHTVLVFDDNKLEASNFIDLLYAPPDWSDDYYGRSSKSPALDQIVDTPFVVKSHHVGLVQLADVFAAVFRRHAELQDLKSAESFPGEAAQVADWVAQLTPRLVSKAHRCPARTTSELAHWLRDVCPASLLLLGS